MDSELRAAARILATSTSPNVVTEVARDLLARWPQQQIPSSVAEAAEFEAERVVRLMHVGQYVATVRAGSVGAVVRATEDAAATGGNALAAAALAGGMAAGLLAAGQRVDAAVAAFVRTARAAAAAGAGDRDHGLPLLRVCANVVLLLPARALADLAHGGDVLAAAGSAALLGDLGDSDLVAVRQLVDAPTTRLADIERLAHAAYAVAHDSAGSEPLTCCDPVVAVCGAVLRSLADRGDPRGGGAAGAWVAAVAALACVHAAVLRRYGRAGSADFGSATADALRCAASLPPAAVDECARALLCQAAFAAPLFCLDFCEHLVSLLPAATLAAYVVPLAARFTSTVDVADCFESAHALVLAVLDSSVMAASDAVVELAVQLVPWYTDLLCELYPDRGISVDLLRIAYPAAVRAIAQSPLTYALAWDRVTKLLTRTDELFPSTTGASRIRSEINATRRRELLMTVAELLTAVPAELLPQLMDEVRNRIVAEPAVTTRQVLLDYCQDMVLSRADITRKP
ncbi:hypothetical protein GGI04_001934, partial [Coemansia thaxteri]